MDTGTPETAELVTSAPPKRKRRSPTVSKVTFEADGDGRLLSLIRNATFISHKQLLGLALCLGIKSSKDAIRKRIRRYLENGLIRLVPAVPQYVCAVYQITREGLSALESLGTGISSISSETETLPSALQAPHFLDINEVRLAFSRDPILSRGDWLTDPEIKARNTTPGVIPYAKDYDAILKLTDRSGQEFLVGLEYERTYKDAHRYDEIAQRIETERQLCCVLYIAGSIDLVARLIDSICCPRFPLCVTTAGVLKQQCLESNIGFMAGGSRRRSTLRQYLASLKHPI
jgi:hypothetical protein